MTKRAVDVDLCSNILNLLIAYNASPRGKYAAWLYALLALEQAKIEHPVEYKKALQIWERDYAGKKERRDRI